MVELFQNCGAGMYFILGFIYWSAYYLWQTLVQRFGSEEMKYRLHVRIEKRKELLNALRCMVGDDLFPLFMVFIAAVLLSLWLVAFLQKIRICFNKITLNI
ncbi:hypothetical protein ACODM8_13670 [Vibrio ostreicida]|uniref:hypothetical protein n=1 Tax=Vibrio ostreicida TaxID=526588 RepID=UPI003B5981AA